MLIVQVYKTNNCQHFCLHGPNQNRGPTYNIIRGFATMMSSLILYRRENIPIPIYGEVGQGRSSMLAFVGKVSTP